MKPLIKEVVADRIEQMKGLDHLGESIQKAWKKLVPDGSQIKDVLSGTWLGHPLHALLTDVVVGCWQSSFLIDFVPGKHSDEASQKLIGLGILAAVPTAAAGLSDWNELWGGQRRIGLVHAAGNVGGVALMTMSWLARRRGRRGLGRLLSFAGTGGMVGSAWLGGHLAYGKGVGVSQTVFEDMPSEWTAVMEERDLPERTLVGAKAGDVGVLLLRQDGRLYALADKCTHRGCPLHDGELNDSTITCPCHGSTFRLDGSVVRGPTTSPQPSYEVRARDGKIEVRFPQE